MKIALYFDGLKGPEIAVGVAQRFAVGKKAIEQNHEEGFITFEIDPSDYAALVDVANKRTCIVKGDGENSVMTVRSQLYPQMV